MNLSGDDLQKGILGLVGSILAGLFTWLMASRIKHQNAKDGRESRYEENVQARLEAALGKISELNDEIDALKFRLAEADKRLTVVQMIADGDATRAIEITRDSAFIDLTRPLRPRPKTPPPSSLDPFQAADPYAPPKKPRKT